MRSRALGVGPADHDELLTVQAFDLSPEAAVAGLVGAVQPFRDDALDPELAGIAIKALSTHNMMFAVLQPGGALASNASRRSFLTRSGSPVRSSPSKKRRSNSTRTSSSVLRASVAACIALNEVRPCSDGRVFIRPIKPRTGQEAHVPSFDAGVHPVAVPLQLVGPLAAFGCGFRQRRELRRHKVGQGAYLASANGSPHLGPSRNFFLPYATPTDAYQGETWPQALWFRQDVRPEHIRAPIRQAIGLRTVAFGQV